MDLLVWAICSVPWSPGSVWAKLSRRGGRSYLWESHYQLSTVKKQDQVRGKERPESKAFPCLPKLDRRHLRGKPRSPTFKIVALIFVLGGVTPRLHDPH